MEKFSPLREVPTPFLLITPEAGSGAQRKAPSPTPGHQLSSATPGLWGGQCSHPVPQPGQAALGPLPSLSLLPLPATHTPAQMGLLFTVVMCLGAIDCAGVVCFLGYDWWKPRSVYSMHCDFCQGVTENGLRPWRDGVDAYKKIRLFKEV